MMTATPLTATARVETERAAGYLSQMCKHFRHKTEVEFNDTSGRIQLNMGACALSLPDNATLLMEATAADADSLRKVEDIIDRHLVRFGFREELTINWIDAA